MSGPRWAVGDASHQHWVMLPESFDERTQKVICDCGRPLFPMYSGNPREAGYGEASKHTPTLVPL